MSSSTDTDGENPNSHPESLRYRKVQTHGLQQPSPSNSRPLLRALAFSPDGHYIAGTFDRKVVVWGLNVPAETQEERALEEWEQKLVYRLDDRVQDEALTCLVWTSSDFLLLGSSTGDVRVITIGKNATRMKGFQATRSPIRFLSLDQAGFFLAVVAGDREVSVWYFEEDTWIRHSLITPPDSQLPREVDGQPGCVTFLGWNQATGGMLIVAYLGHGVFSWNTDTRKLKSLLHHDKVYSGALSPNGNLFAIPGARGTFVIWDLNTKDKVTVLHEPAEEVSAGHSRQNDRPSQFVHDGEFLFGAGIGKLNLWNASRNIRAQRLNLGQEFKDSPIAFFTISSTNSEHSNDIRIAACTCGPSQQIDMWKARVPKASFAFGVEPSSSAGGQEGHGEKAVGATALGVLGIFIAGTALRWM